MTKTELKNALFSQLSALLGPHGFALIRRMDWFVRKGDPNLIYRLDFYDGHWKDMGYTVSPSLAIRIDGVEQLYHKVSGFEPKYQKDTPTIWVTIRDLRKGSEEYEYALNSHEDVELLAEELFRVFRDLALSYLEENSSVQAINMLLNSDPQNENSIFAIPEHRYFKGVIAAKLADDGRYKEIAEIYRNKLAQSLPDRLADFNRLLKILDAI